MADLNQYTGTWTIDPTHTRLGFVARHAMVTKVRGSFTDFEGSLTLRGDQLAGGEALRGGQQAVIQAGSPAQISIGGIPDERCKSEASKAIGLLCIQDNLFVIQDGEKWVVTTHSAFSFHGAIDRSVGS